MCRVSKKVSSWLLLILFTSFVGGISLFTHTHIIDEELYLHSHPYDKSESKQHAHTKGQLQLLDLYYNTTLEPDVVPNIDLFAFLEIKNLIYTWVDLSFENTNKSNHFRLRAPPAL